MSKKDKLKKILSKLSTFDDGVEESFFEINKEISTVSEKIKEALTAKTIEQVNKEFRKIQDSLTPLSQALADLNQKISERESVFSQRAADLERDLRLIHTQVQTSSDGNEELEESISLIRKSLEEAVTSNKNNQKNVSDLGESLKTLSKQIKELSKNDPKSDIDRLKRDLEATIESKYKKIKDEFSRLQGDFLVNTARGGNSNRQIRVEGADVLTRYTDINLVGATSSITTSVDNTNKRVNIIFPSGTGDVVGPGSSTDNAIARFDGTTGKIIQNSGITIDDSNNIRTPASINFTNASLSSIFSTISSPSNNTLSLEGSTYNFGKSSSPSDVTFNFLTNANSSSFNWSNILNAFVFNNNFFLGSGVVFYFSTTSETIGGDELGGIVYDAGTNHRFFINSGEEMTVVANGVNFNNGATTTALGWATNGVLDIKVANAVEASFAANTLTFNNGTNDTSLGWATNNQLDITAGLVNIIGSLQCDSITNDTGLAAGTYTPNLTNVANLDGSTAYSCQYIRVGNTVTVSGKVDVDPTLTATSTQLGISLPISSNIGATEDCAGTAFASGIAGQGAAILGDATNNRAQMQWVSTDVTNQPMYFTFTYEVI